MSEQIKTTQMLPSNQIDHARVRKLVQTGSVSHLSPDREMAPFLLYLNGDSIEEIAFKQSLPKDVLEVTAVHYNWEIKRSAFAASGVNLAQELQKRMANTLLITAYVATLRDLAEVAAGTKDAKDCLFIPKSVGALQQLMDLANKANGEMPADPNKPAQAAVPGVAVQIITGGSGDTVEVKQVDQQEKAKMLRDMAQKSAAKLKKV